jgi:outer membrane immunogenic protein
MKKLLILASTALLTAVASPVFAQDSGALSPTTFYGNAGGAIYQADFGAGRTTLGALGGRLGARFGKYLGGEGELAFGVNSQTVGGANVKISSAYAGYLVGYLPAGDNFDLFARVGYGHQNSSVTVSNVTVSAGNNTYNLGVGGQYFFSKKDGVRAEYTRFQHATSSDGDVNVYSVAYVRKF